jgi:hypothetical protein
MHRPVSHTIARLPKNGRACGGRIAQALRVPTQHQMKLNNIFNEWHEYLNEILYKIDYID